MAHTTIAPPPPPPSRGGYITTTTRRPHWAQCLHYLEHNALAASLVPLLLAVGGRCMPMQGAQQHGISLAAYTHTQTRTYTPHTRWHLFILILYHIMYVKKQYAHIASLCIYFEVEQSVLVLMTNIILSDN